MLLDFIEENKGFVVFIACVFVTLILVGINIFTPLPFMAKYVLGTFSNLLFCVIFAWFVFWCVRQMWEFPELESWEWILVVGILFTLIFMFLSFALGASHFSMFDMVAGGMGFE